MTATWTPDELERIGGADELESAARRTDGPGSVDAMVADAAAAATLRLSPE